MSRAGGKITWMAWPVAGGLVAGGISAVLIFSPHPKQSVFLEKVEEVSGAEEFLRRNGDFGRGSSRATSWREGGPGADGGSLQQQALAFERFETGYEKDPSSLKALAAELRLPPQLKLHILGAAVRKKMRAVSEVGGVLKGIESMEGKEIRTALIGEAVPIWANADPAAAFEWAAGSAYPDSLTGVIVPYWRKNPEEVIARLDGLPAKQAVGLVSLLTSGYFDIPVAAEKRMLQTVSGLAAQGDQEACFAEGGMLRRLVSRDPDYVEDYLSRATSSGLIDGVAADLALARGENDWKAANEWLEDYNSRQPLTRSEVILWQRWAASGDPGLIDYLESSAGSPRHEDMTKVLRNFAGDKNSSEVAEWIKARE